MGWTITIDLSRPIRREEMAQILQQMPLDRQNPLSHTPVPQGWGWSMAVDVWWPQGQTEAHQVRLGGAWGISGNAAQPFCQDLCDRLRIRGFGPHAGPVT